MICSGSGILSLPETPMFTCSKHNHVRKVHQIKAATTSHPHANTRNTPTNTSEWRPPSMPWGTVNLSRARAYYVHVSVLLSSNPATSRTRKQIVMSKHTAIRETPAARSPSAACLALDAEGAGRICFGCLSVSRGHSTPTYPSQYLLYATTVHNLEQNYDAHGRRPPQQHAKKSACG